MTETVAPQPDSADPAASKPKKRRRGVVNPDLLQLDSALLDRPLASWWQRAGAMAVDLTLIGAVSLLANTVLGLLTGLTIASLGSGKVSDSRFWKGFRWVLIGLGVGVMILSGFLLIGRPIIRTSAFNLTQTESAPEIESITLSPTPSTSELRRAVHTLERNVDILEADNTRLRETARGSSWMNFAADSSRTLGLTFGWAGVYFTILTAWLKGRTPGKLLFRIRVVRLDGRPLTAMDAFTRNGGYAAGLATGSIGFLRLLWDANGQAIEDKIAGTVVVSTRSRPASSARHVIVPASDTPVPPAAAP